MQKTNGVANLNSAPILKILEEREAQIAQAISVVTQHQQDQRLMLVQEHMNNEHLSDADEGYSNCPCKMCFGVRLAAIMVYQRYETEGEAMGVQ